MTATKKNKTKPQMKTIVTIGGPRGTKKFISFEKFLVVGNKLLTDTVMLNNSFHYAVHP